MTLKEFAAKINELAIADMVIAKGMVYCEPEAWAEVYASDMTPEEAWDGEKACAGDYQ